MPKRDPAYWDTMPAAGGWNMETPMDPMETKRSKTRYEGATPMRGMKTVARSGPPRIKTRV